MNSTVTLAALSDEFIQIPTCILQVLDRTCVDLYLRHEPGESPILYRDAEYPLSEDRIRGITEKFQDTLFVRTRDYSSFSKDLNLQLENIIEGDKYTSAFAF